MGYRPRKEAREGATEQGLALARVRASERGNRCLAIGFPIGERSDMSLHS